MYGRSICMVANMYARSVSEMRAHMYMHIYITYTYTYTYICTYVQI